MKNLASTFFSRDPNRYTDQSWNLFKKQLILSVPGKKVQKLGKASSSPNGLFRMY